MVAWERQCWLHEFRRSLEEDSDAIEFARFATSYNPHGSSRRIPVSKCIDKASNLQQATSTQKGNSRTPECSDLIIGTVTDVYSCGVSAFVRSRDIQLDLAKIYLLLTTAKKRLRGNKHKVANKDRNGRVSSVPRERHGDEGHDGFTGAGKGFDKEIEWNPAVLDAVIRTFERYVVICMALAEKCPLKDTPKHGSISLEAATLDAQQRDLPHSITNFRLNPADYRKLMGISEPEIDVRVPLVDADGVTILSWDFYKDASCSDVFKLLCYSLMMGNFEAYNVILQNHGQCMLKHVQDNWHVLLSYVPLVCKYRKCRQVIEKVFNASLKMSEKDSINAVDWTIWRSYLILKATRCSYYLLLSFLRTMSDILAEVNTNSTAVRSRIHVMLSMMSLVKQYVIYRSFKMGGTMGLKELEEAAYLTFSTYLQLKPSDKLQLFIDCIELPSGSPEDCECDEAYKDKHRIYPSCLYCKTLNGINTLTTFLRLIRIADGEGVCENQLCASDSVFNEFFEAMKRCAYATISDYMEGIHRKFCGTLDSEVFKLLYVLTRAMSLTDFRHKTRSVVLGILYNCDSTYNVLENYFIFKSIIASLESGENGADSLSQNEEESSHELLAILGDSYLGKLLQVYRTNTQSDVGLAHMSPHYTEFRNLIEQTNDKLTLPLALQVVRCQVGFVEAVLNLLSLVGALPSREHGLCIAMDELTEALGDSGKALLLVQRILVYILHRELSGGDFRNCIYALQDVVAYINAISVNDLHMMFFYTICVCSANAKYLEAQCNVWLTLSSKGVDHVLTFVKASLCSVKATLYRLSTQAHVHFAFAKLILNLPSRLHEGICELQYLKHPVSKTVLDIHDLLGVYLKVVGMNWDGDVAKDRYNALALIENVHANAPDTNYDEMLDELRKLGLIQRVSVVLKSFKCNYHRIDFSKSTLDYQLYHNKRDLVDNALTNLAYACMKDSDGLSSGCELHWTLFIFALVLRSAFNDGTDVEYGVEEILKKLQQLKTDAVLVLPRKIRKDVEEVMDVLIWAFQEGHARGTIEPQPLIHVALSGISAVLFGSSYMKSMDFVGLAKICGQMRKEQLPELVSFLSEQIGSYPESGEGAYTEAAALSASKMTLFEVLTGPDCNSEAEPRKWTGPNVNDLVVRTCILKLLSKVNLSKIEVCQGDKMKISFDKITHRFTGNTASGLLSKALGKAETGLSSITMKKMQFETLKGKFFTASKKSAENFNGCFLPVLNFYNTAVLCISDYDLSDMEHMDGSSAVGNDLMKWRSVSQLELLQLLQMNPQLGVMRLLEICNFTFNTVFVEQLHLVFHNFNVSQCLRVLDTLSTQLSRMGWPHSLFIHLDAIRKFLNNFQSFPSETDVYIGRFTASSKYRVTLFSEVADYVADNMKEFLHIYMCLDALFSCQEFGLESPRRTRVEFNLEETIGALWTDAPIPEEHVEILDPLLMKEYICVLMKSFEKTFWSSNLTQLEERFKRVEPDFLQIQEQYRDCLLSLYEEHKKKRLYKAEHWIYWRKLVYRYLVIYPEEEASFNRLFKPISKGLIQMLEAIHRTTEGLDITEVDNFEVFKKILARKLTLNNYFEILNAMRLFDATSAKVLLESMDVQLRSTDGLQHFDAARALYNLDLSSARQW